MRYNGDGMSKVLSKLNESQSVPFVEAEPTIGVDAKPEVHRCAVCGGFYKGDPEICPVCGDKIPEKFNESRKSRKRKLREADEVKLDIDNDDEEILDEDEEEEVIDTVQDNEKLPKDVEVEINEAMRLLSKGNYKKFNESYKSTKLLKNGKINFLVESERTGRMYSVVRKPNAIQKANYKLAESMNVKTSRRASASAKLESVRAARASLAALTEMNAVKVATMRMLERQGIRFDFAKMNESLNKTISESSKRFRKKFEAIDSDKDTGAVDFTESTPEEIAQDVTEVIKDTGLEVVTQDVDATTDTAAIQVRVQDDPNLEVNLQDIADATSEVMDAPIAVVGPSKPEGDSTLADITVLVNPDEDLIEDEEKVALSESLRRKIYARKLRESYSLKECDDIVVKDKEEIEEDEDKIEYPKLSERRSLRRKRKLHESEDEEQKMIDAEYDDLDAEDDELKAEKKLSEKRRLRKIKEADEDMDDLECKTKKLDEDDDEDDDEDTKIVITEDEDDDEDIKVMIDQAKKLEEKIRRARRRK